jgi:hypothetical protein
MGRRFYLADPRALSAPGRARLSEIAAELADPAAAARWFDALELDLLPTVAAPHDALAELLSNPPAADHDRITGGRVRAELDRHGLAWLADDARREAHAQRAWDALYTAHAGVVAAVAQVESLTHALRVCRLAELADSGAEPTWRELADAASARPMIPAEIYRAGRARRRPLPEQVAHAVALPVSTSHLDAAELTNGATWSPPGDTDQIAAAPE